MHNDVATRKISAAPQPFENCSHTDAGRADVGKLVRGCHRLALLRHVSGHDDGGQFRKGVRTGSNRHSRLPSVLFHNGTVDYLSRFIDTTCAKNLAASRRLSA